MVSFSFFIGSFLGLLLVVLGTFYALHLREHHPENYRGIWRYLGSVGTRRKNAMFLVGISAGTVMGAILVATLQPDVTQSNVLLINSLTGLVMLFSILVAITIHQQKNKGE
ncbi:MAG: hypothetical protein GFH27_549325n82 [Chloroflexi bacterium AL-W]|nr:hypothetical protein [Chloroflexi bacterium AL-N1]NOK70068.1 hypothetical protein [Chloroflexi bacterium AL-N10]NOK77920.1 hypothetical protein [Chloroflexi bacterium AL-N5]NOK84929.1 hypothetical protein [Chloroflexi bacterium AL-W]NOK91908.1 hypothetical protein [Chloroflexi bacterium AL-N15]